jgi:hypothetical protein
MSSATQKRSAFSAPQDTPEQFAETAKQLAEAYASLQEQRRAATLAAAGAAPAAKTEPAAPPENESAELEQAIRDALAGMSQNQLAIAAQDAADPEFQQVTADMRVGELQAFAREKGYPFAARDELWTDDRRALLRRAVQTFPARARAMVAGSSTQARGKIRATPLPDAPASVLDDTPSTPAASAAASSTPATPATATPTPAQISKMRTHPQLDAVLRQLGQAPPARWQILPAGAARPHGEMTIPQKRDYLQRLLTAPPSTPQSGDGLARERKQLPLSVDARGRFGNVVLDLPRLAATGMLYADGKRLSPAKLDGEERAALLELLSRRAQPGRDWPARAVEFFKLAYAASGLPPQRSSTKYALVAPQHARRLPSRRVTERVLTEPDEVAHRAELLAASIKAGNTSREARTELFELMRWLTQKGLMSREALRENIAEYA